MSNKCPAPDVLRSAARQLGETHPEVSVWLIGVANSTQRQIDAQAPRMALKAAGMTNRQTRRHLRKAIEEAKVE